MLNPKNDGEALIIQDYGKGLLTENLTKKAIEAFREKGGLVCVDPHGEAPPLRYRGASLLKPNRIEARAMVRALGRADHGLQESAEILSDKLSIEKVVITLGEEGMAVFDRTDRERPFHLLPPLLKKEVFDVSGAGDTALALLTASLASGATLLEAAHTANRGAGIVVSKRGTAAVTLEDLSS